MAGINITQGTQSNIATDAIGTVNYQIVKLDRGAAGASSLFTGTLDALTIGSVRMTVGTLTGGTLQNLVSGTVNALASGTVSAGTVQTYGLRHADAFATIVSNSGTVLGTVKAGVAGSAHYITDMLISSQGASNAVLYAGSTLVRAGTYYFAANGGLVNNLNTPITVDSGSAITFSTVGTGLVTLEIRGYID